MLVQSVAGPPLGQNQTTAPAPERDLGACLPATSTHRPASLLLCLAVRFSAVAVYGGRAPLEKGLHLDIRQVSARVFPPLPRSLLLCPLDPIVDGLTHHIET